MDPSELCGIRWIHLFEDDTPTGSVYRPDSTKIPLSRRPRRRFELHPDGTATLFTGGPDDRFESRPGVWRTNADGVVVTFPADPQRAEVRFRVADGSTSRLAITDEVR